MFKGSFTFSLDAKGRLNIPAKIRRDINPEANGAFVFTRGPLQNIDLYPYDQWKMFETKLKSLNIFDPKQGMVMRRFLETAVEDKIDGQNRVLLPKPLMEFAGIEKEVFILGTLNKIELWNPAKYEEYINKEDMAFEDIAQQVMINN
jgi:MraZ protein